MHALISGLAEHHDVSLLSLVDSNEDPIEEVLASQAYCDRVVTVPNPRTTAKRLWQLAALFSPWSYERLTTRVPAFQDALDRMLAGEPYDVVQFEFPYLVPYRVRAPDGSRPPICIDEHNIEYEILSRTARVASSPLRRAYNMVDWLKVRSEEGRAWARADGCALPSSRDQRILLERAPKMRTAIVPNGVDLDFFRPGDQARREPATLLFFGAINYFPNTDAILFFLDEVMPRLTSRHPAVKLCIVGQKPPPTVLARRGPNVEVTGEVDDLRPWLERATAVIVPLRIGGGTRLKILEAMAMGKTVVSTSLGAEGLDVADGRELLIADDPERFAAQARRAIDEPQLADRIGEAARRLVAARYGWNASVDRLSELHAELIEAPRLQ